MPKTDVRFDAQRATTGPSDIGQQLPFG